jgi:PKD repeat protein
MSYAWTFGDGGTASVQNPSHTYTAAGSFSANLTITDANGATASPTTLTIAVSGAPPPVLCTSVTASSAPPSPRAPGTAVTITALASGCPNPLYQFWMLTPGSSTWTVAQAYSNLATFNWTTTGLASGIYHFSVWARDTSSAGTSCNSLGCNDAFVPGFAYTLSSTACTSVTATPAPSPASPQTLGTTITITGSASGCGSTSLYQFWILNPGSSTWTIARAYSSTASFSWSSQPFAGTYHFSIWARDTNSTGTSCNSLGCSDAFVPGFAYTLTSASSTPCTSVTATPAPSPASPQAAGTAITISGSAAGCTNPRYQFWVLAPGGTWTIGQAYSNSATFNWVTTGKAAGAYYISIWARDAGSPGNSCSSLGCSDAFVPGFKYTLTSTPCASVTATVAPPSTAPRGTTVVITGNASGCPNALYQFWVLAPGSTTWTIGQAYSNSATFNWNTTGLAAGTWRYSVWVRDASSSGTTSTSLGSFDAFVPATTYTLT